MADRYVNIIGAGLSGLSAAVTLSKMGVHTNLISSQPSERAQSVLAEGGINGALNTMGENDTTFEHFNDTMKGGCYLESETAVRHLTENAPEIVLELYRLGTPFNCENGKLVLRNFGGQKKKRTAFAKSSTGKMIMTALIDEVRKYEAQGLVRRYPHHELVGINAESETLRDIIVKDNYTGIFYSFTGCTILCSGGLNGFFEGMTTGTVTNTGNAAALAFNAGAEFSDLEFIQYHPTTVQISGKRMLISEAARGEGGRLYITKKNGERYYFMEDRYPELGNLMPRDVVSREMYFVTHSEEYGGEVYLDMTSLSDDVWDNKLSDLRKEIISYMKLDPKIEPVSVSPGIHFFMGGIRVNDSHETNITGLLAAGEAACKYHGANRLGGNSMLGAVYGGRVAAQTVGNYADACEVSPLKSYSQSVSLPAARARLRDILSNGLGIVRNETEMMKIIEELSELLAQENLSETDKMRTRLGLAMARSAYARKESRGAHYRSDYPDTSEEFRKLSVISYNSGKLTLKFVFSDSERK